MRRYRYRTAALTGPWRDSEKEALGDAIKAGQAEFVGDPPSETRWIVPGKIEEYTSEEIHEKSPRLRN